MRIDSTTLSMDALSSHKEMATTVTGFAGLTNWQKFLREGGVESHFSLQPGFLQDSSSAETSSQLAEQSQKEDATRSCDKQEPVKEEKNDSFSREEDLAGGCSSAAKKEASLLLPGFIRETTIECSSSLEFSSCGKVQTEDGRTIDFSLNLSAYEKAEAQQIEYGFTDPLTLAVGDSVPSLSDAVFAFDLDGDGRKENISSLSSGSGFLALDKNGDGIINNGGELFGPQRGSGYGELGEYDLDDNLWIDENDPIFSELKIWIGAGSKDARLVSLKEAGVGALSLANVGTAFDMRGKNGKLLGRMEHSGLYLKESGEVKSMAEIDLAHIPTKEEDIFALLQPEQQEGENDPLLQALRAAIVRLEALLAGRRKEAIAFDNDHLVTTIQQEVSLKSKFWQWQQQELVAG